VLDIPVLINTGGTSPLTIANANTERELQSGTTLTRRRLLVCEFSGGRGGQQSLTDSLARRRLERGSTVSPYVQDDWKVNSR